MADGTDLSDILRRTVQANAKFYKGWMDLSVEYFRGISEIFGGAPASVAPVLETNPGTGALVLEGEAGTRLRAAFLVTNDMERAVSCEFVATDLKDPNGTSVSAKATFEPPTMELAPGEQRVIHVILAIDDRFSPGVGYAGEFSVSGMDGFSVPVVVRRQHRIDESPVGGQQPRAEPSAGATNAPPASHAKTAKKSKGKKARG